MTHILRQNRTDVYICLDRLLRVESKTTSGREARVARSADAAIQRHLGMNTLQIARIVETLRVRLSNPRLMSSPDFSG